MRPQPKDTSRAWSGPSAEATRSPAPPGVTIIAVCPSTGSGHTYTGFLSSRMDTAMTQIQKSA